jgi:hypothetical protein
MSMAVHRDYPRLTPVACGPGDGTSSGPGRGGRPSRGLEFSHDVVYGNVVMRLSKLQIEHLAFSIVRNLVRDGKIITDNKNALVEDLNNLITEEFLSEDKLDQEVREILNQHMEKIRRENIEYQTMFKMIKTKLAKEKNIVL